MRTPQLTEQYGQVDRVSVARAILSSLSCATAGVRSNPRRETPAPPTRAPRRKFLRESSIASSDSFDTLPGLHRKFGKTIVPPLPTVNREKPVSFKDETRHPMVACREPKPDNRPVTTSPWQQRIRRAEHLAAKHPFAEEFLRFYIHLAAFQQRLYDRLRKSSAGRTPAVLLEETQSASRPLSGQQDGDDIKPLLAAFPEFLVLVEEKAPTPLAQIARDLRSSDPNSWHDLFTQVWTHIDSPTDPQEFLVLAFLQPYAEFARSQANLRLEGYTSLLCPFCNR